MYIAKDKLGLTAWTVEPYYVEDRNMFDSEESTLVLALPDDFDKIWGVSLKNGQCVKVIMEIVR